MSFWTDDAVVLAPSLPAVVGKDALRGYVEGSLQIPGFRISWNSTDVAFSPDRRLAYMFSANAVTMNGPDGLPATSPGRGVTIWRREADDLWRCAVDIWNAEQPGAELRTSSWDLLRPQRARAARSLREDGEAVTDIREVLNFLESAGYWA